MISWLRSRAPRLWHAFEAGAVRAKCGRMLPAQPESRPLQPDDADACKSCLARLRRMGAPHAR